MLLISTIALALLATLIVALSFWGVLFPQHLMSFVRTFMRRPGTLVFAVAIRILLAGLLWVVAPASNTPTIFEVLAGVALLAAVGIALVGSERVSKLIEYVASWPRFVVRLQCLLGVAFGLFLIWSVLPVWAAT
jgi:hypothetical protein